EVIAQIFGGAIEAANVVAHPVEVLFAGTGIDDQQEFALPQAVHDDVVHEGALRIEQGGVLSLPNGQPRGIVHSDVLGRFQRLRAGNADITHVADVKNTDASTHSQVFGNQATGGRVLDRHVPAVEFHHLGAHAAMHGVEGGLAHGGSGFDAGGQSRTSSLICLETSGTCYGNMRIFRGSNPVKTAENAKDAENFGEMAYAPALPTSSARRCPIPSIAPR